MNGNRLLQAIISAPFKGAQRQIVLTIHQLSAEQQRQSVQVSLAELAIYCGAEAASGGFRRQLRELIDQGVVVVATEGGGASTNGYGLELDFTKWGEFKRADDDLAKIWGKAAEHAEQLPLAIITVERSDLAPAGSGSIEKPSDLAPPGTRYPASTGARVPPQGQGTLPLQGHPAPTGARSPSERSAGAASDSLNYGSRRSPRGGVGGGVVSSSRTTTTPPKPPRGEAMELLAAIDKLRERITPPQGPSRPILKVDVVREKLGADAADAIEMLGVERYLATKPEKRDILVLHFAEALERIRIRPERATG